MKWLKKMPRWGWFVLAAVAVLLVVLWGNWPPWTGFGEASFPKSDKLEYRPAKTLWDWLGLLIIPLSLAGAGLWFTHWREKQAREYEQRRREEEKELAGDRLREEVLQGYIDRMADLMLHEKLGQSAEGDPVRDVARSRTLLALRRLDGRRKGLLLRFLRESELVIKGEEIVRLYKADLRRAILTQADLRGVGLNGADLRKAILKRAALHGADLHSADLRDADLCGAYLGKYGHSPEQETVLAGALLARADLSGVDLSQARGLSQQEIDSARGDASTRLPEGFKRPTSWAGAAARSGAIAGGSDRSAGPAGELPVGSGSVGPRDG